MGATVCCQCGHSGIISQRPVEVAPARALEDLKNAQVDPLSAKFLLPLVGVLVCDYKDCWKLRVDKLFDASNIDVFAAVRAHLGAHVLGDFWSVVTAVSEAARLRKYVADVVFSQFNFNYAPGTEVVSYHCKVRSIDLPCCSACYPLFEGKNVEVREE